MQHALKHVERPGGSHEGVGRKKILAWTLWWRQDFPHKHTILSWHHHAQRMTLVTVQARGLITSSAGVKSRAAHILSKQPTWTA